MKKLLALPMLLALSGCASQEWKDYCSEYNCFDDAAHDGSFYGNTTTVTGWLIKEEKDQE